MTLVLQEPTSALPLLLSQEVFLLLFWGSGAIVFLAIEDKNGPVLPAIDDIKEYSLVHNHWYKEFTVLDIA
jgi:hypothetical protein